MPNVKYAKFDIPIDSRLQKYTQQLVNIIKNSKENDNTAFIAFRDQLFHDSFAFIRNELKTAEYPLITVDFVPTQTEYEMLEQQSNFYVPQKEKPKIPTLGFAITSNYENIICVNLEPLLKLLEINVASFIFNLISTLVHEILHCFFHSLKDEQETFNLQCEMLESFLGVTLPAEMKATKTTDFYIEKNDNL